MTQEEFQTRVQMTVSYKEFDAINEVYMNSDLEKDDFCKAWVKMNQSRVNKAKAEAKAQAEKEAQREALYNIINKDWSYSYEYNADECFNKKQKILLDKVGIDIVERRFSFPYPKAVSSVIYEIKKYLEIA